MCTEYIYRHIQKLPATCIFTTRELLRYGNRGAVDQTLYRMVRSGFIVRLARGVFVRDDTLQPTKRQIALAKAIAWGKQLVAHAESVLNDLGLPVTGNFTQAFAVNAHSSSYWTIRGRVYLKGIGTRKMKLCESKVGQIVYCLWYLGQSHCTTQDVARASANFGRSERKQFLDASSLMPAWLNRICKWRFPAAWMP